MKFFKKSQPKTRTPKEQIKRAVVYFWIFSTVSFLLTTCALVCLWIATVELFSPIDDKTKFWLIWLAAIGFIGLSFEMQKEAHNWLKTSKDLKDRYDGTRY